jgi:site-specific DNA-cytosine methylase
MKILSLFDGISCGRVALERAGIPVEAYYASEIEKNAIKISNKNYGSIVHLGSITDIGNNRFFNELPEFDLLIGGSPCQDLSNYKYDRGDVKGLDGEKSNLFYHFVRLLKETKPKYFLLENVASMQKKWVDVISQELGVEPIMINSSLVCGAERKRLYWTNIPGVTQPANKNINLKDIILPAEQVPEKYWYTKYDVQYNGSDKKVEATILLNGHRQAKEVYNLNNKCNTLLCDGNGGNLVKKVYQNGKVRKLTPLEYERLQTLPDNYTDGVSDSARYTAIGNGWTVDVIAHILSFIPKH